MRVVEAGSESAPPLVLVHGFLVSHAEFDDVIDALAADFRVIAPDLPGFGDSEKPGPKRYAYGIETFAESIADLVAAYGVARVHVLGHALGGAVALTLAAQHAELVARLVVVDPLSYPSPPSFKAKLWLFPVVGGLVFKQLYGRTLFRGYFRDEVYAEGARFDAGRVDMHYDKFNAPAARESAHATMHALVDTRTLVARLGRIRASTLVVWGGKDKVFPVANATRLARELATASLEVMDTGHAPHEEDPAAFVKLVRDFLQGKR